MRDVTEPVPKRSFRWRFAGINLVILAVFTVSGYLYFDKQEKRFLQATHDRLNTVADLKVRQITDWRKNQLMEAESIQSAPLLTAYVQAFLTNSATDEPRRQLLGWMSWFSKRTQFKRMTLLDSQLQQRWTFSASPTRDHELDLRLAQEAIQKNQVTFSELHAMPDSHEVHLDLMVPILAQASVASPPPGAKPLALLLLTINLQDYLYPLIQTWPTIAKSPTAETLLVQREGNEVVFLNELRHRSNTALTLRLPIIRQDLPATQAVLGHEGIFHGRDYRQVPVVAATRKIAGSPWCLVAKVDQTEIYGPLRADAQHISLVVGLCILAANVGLRLLWSKREAEFQLRQRQDKMSVLSRMAGGVAHEVRNPLTAIKARLFTLSKGLQAGSPEQQDAQVIGKEIDRIERIVKEFLLFARPAEPRLVSMEAAKPLREVQELLAPQLSGAQIDLQLQGGAQGTIKADPELLKQVLINLVQNAAEAIGRSGTITLRAQQRKMPRNGFDSSMVVLEVEDSGPGIPPEVQKRLFEPFFTTKPGGSGLGLTIVSTIVEKHHGLLEFQTDANRGTIFSILLPLAEKPAISDRG